MTERPELIDGIVDRVTRYLTDPPRRDDKVIELASPDELVARFATTVGLTFGEVEPPHRDDEMLHAVEQVIDLSMHTSHPRFVNQNFAGPDPISVVGDWLGAALNTTGATYEAAPVFTLMESAVLTDSAVSPATSTRARTCFRHCLRACSVRVARWARSSVCSSRVTATSPM